MALKFPAETFSEAVDLAIDGANKLRDFVNGDINTTISTEEGGDIPSVAKALNEAAAYRTPIAWNNGDVQTDLVQPRDFNNSIYVPRIVPVTLGASPTTGPSGEWRLLLYGVPTTVTHATGNIQTATDHTHSLDLSDTTSAALVGQNGDTFGTSTPTVQSCLDEIKNTLPTTGISSYMKTVLDDVDDVEARQTLGLGGGVGSDTIPVARLPAATETEIGAVEKATTAEAEAGTAGKFPDAAGVNSAILALSPSVNALPGQQALPGGLIMKFGEVSSHTSGNAINFDTPFPNQCIMVLCQDHAVSAATTVPIGVSSTPTASSFIAYHSNTDGPNFWYIAIGY